MNIKMNYPMKFRLAGKFFLLIAFLLPVVLQSKQLPEPPKPYRLVNDHAGLLTAGQQRSLENKLWSYEDSTTNQIAILIEKSLEDEALEDYTQRVAEKWGIGQGDRENGILIYIAVEERAIRIEVGYGLEGAVPDAAAGRIINDYMIPEFRENRHYEGINKAVDIIISLASGEYSAADFERKQEVPVFPILIFLLFFGLMMFIAFLSWRSQVKKIMLQKNVNFATAMLLLGMMNKKASRSRGYGSFRSGTGAFGGGSRGGGFGGGSFGGGGASGRW
jgi:uncharacterized protein